MSIDHDRLKEICEALIFVSEEPLSFRKIQAILEGVPAPELRKVLGELVESWGQREGGFLLVEVAEGYQFRTRSENVEWVRMLVKYKPAKLSKAALETLAIVAYNQPVTRPEVEAIRGVDCSSSLSQLLEKGLVKILGRKDVPGKPFIYGTTPKFLEVMGLRDLGQLPTLREIEESEILQLEEFENEGIISENKGKEDGAEPDSQDSAPLDSEDGDEPDGDDQRRWTKPWIKAPMMTTKMKSPMRMKMSMKKI